MSKLKSLAKSKKLAKLIKSKNNREVENTEETEEKSEEQVEFEALSPEEIMFKLHQQVQGINDQLESLNHHNLVVTYNSLPRFIWFSLLKGIAVGLGSVLGATVVLSALVFVLSQIEFIPVIGEWVTSILEVVQQELDNN